jgi:hypothetical protein
MCGKALLFRITFEIDLAALPLPLKLNYALPDLISLSYHADDLAGLC